MRSSQLEEAGEALGGGLRNMWAVVAPSAAAGATAAAADASVEKVERSLLTLGLHLTLGLQSGDTRLAVLLAAGAVVLVLLLALCCCTCYRRRTLVQAAGRLCAPWRCGMRSTRNSAAAPQRVQDEARA